MEERPAELIALDSLAAGVLRIRIMNRKRAKLTYDSLRTRLLFPSLAYCALVVLAGGITCGEQRALFAEEGDRTSATEQICFVLTGSRRSELEHCGCHSGLRGGVDREALLYERLRETYPNLIAMDVGGWVDSFQTPNERLKTDYLVKVLREMRFDVFNITPYDLAYGTTYPCQLTEGGGGRLISTNIIAQGAAGAGGQTPERLFEPFTVLERPRSDGRRPIRVGVVGVTDRAAFVSTDMQRLKASSHGLPNHEILDAAESLKTYVPRVREKADYVVVLAMMPRPRLIQLANQIEGVDLFVSTWDFQVSGQLTHVSKKTLATTGDQGRSFSQVVVAFDGENRPIDISGGSKDIPGDGPTLPAITRILEQYREDTKQITRNIAVAREKSRFAGRTRCLICHRSNYLQWTRTPHHRAYLTLVEKKQNYNPDCLKCHVTGYGEPDGFIDVMQTGYLVAVQCEVCHGPGRDHVTSLTAIANAKPGGQIRGADLPGDYPRLQGEVPESVCAKCHDRDHDPSFNYERDLPLISHKNTQGPFRRERKSTPDVSNAMMSRKQ